MSLELRDPRLYFRRCAHPSSDTEIPDNRITVQHSLECDDIPGIARELLDGWLQDDEASVTTLTDRVETVQGMQNNITAYHCGGGNQHGTGDEIAGRADWSVEQWNTPSMDQAIRNLAKTKARRWAFYTMPKYGISYYPEWLSLAQIADGTTCGYGTHNDMRLVYGGTTHTDPGKNFPYKKLRDYVHAELDILLGKSPVIVVGDVTGTVDNPHPTESPTPPTPKDWLEEMTPAERQQLVDDIAAAAADKVFDRVLKNGASFSDNVAAQTTRSARLVDGVHGRDGVLDRLRRSGGVQSVLAAIKAKVGA